MHIRRRLVAHTAIVCFACIAVAACALQRAQEAADAQAKMVGMPKEQVLSCMGSPVSTAYAGSTEVWTYDSGDGRTDSYGNVNVWGNRYNASGFGWATTTSRYCKVDVVMNGGRVTRLNYRGPTGGLLTQGEQCAFAVQNCLNHAAEPVAETIQTPPSPQIYSAPTPAFIQPSPCTQQDREQDREIAAEAKKDGFQYHPRCR